MNREKGEYPIEVSAKIIADISAGIYRTPANALKELVSNAFDADAKKVIITTDYPKYTVFTCSDNGKGMEYDEFQKIMTKIGGSFKRKDNGQNTESGRPLIGKIGIGLLAVAQICRKFTVISSVKGSPYRFEAIVDLKPFFEIDAFEKDLIDIGKYRMYEKIPEKREEQYTRIILEDIVDGFSGRLLESEDGELAIENFEWQRGDPETFEEFVEWVKDKRIRELSEYNRMIWELALICPVKYLDDGPVKGYDVIPAIKDRFKKYDFTVIVDGIELKKPLLFPTDDEIKDKTDDFCVYSDITFDGKVGEKRLKFSGYLYHQRKSIWPPELRGILPRIRNVAIGSYDKTLFNYPKSEGPIMEDLSGEIYIDEGLEDALNIDRNSFRESDEVYIKLQEYLFNRIGGGKGITRDIRKRSKERMDKKRESEETDLYVDVEETIRKKLGEKFTISKIKEKKDIPISIDINNRTIKVFENSLFPKKKKQRMVVESVLIFYEVSRVLAKDKNELTEKFYELLQGRKW